MSTIESQTILRVDASARYEASHSRALVKAFVDELRADIPVEIDRHDVGGDVPLIDRRWVDANETDPDERTDAQRRALDYSDSLVADLHRADLLVVGAPVYNFGMPASLKAWIDQVARAGETFEYTEAGPRGLVEDTRAVVVVTSGGVEVGSDGDFATDHLRHVLGFMGIEDVEFVAADGLLFDDESIDRARSRLQVLADEIAAEACPTRRRRMAS